MLLLLLACTADPPGGTKVPPSAGESGLDSADTAAPENTDPPELSVESTDTIVCADPIDRSTEEAYIPAAPPTWTEGFTSDEGDMLPGGEGLAVADLNGDGLLDLLLPGDPSPRLYMGTGNQTWEEESAERFPASDFHNLVGIYPADHDGDGDLDLLLLALSSANALWENDGEGHFTDVTPEELALEEEASNGASWGDIDGDDDLDLIITGNRGSEGPDPPDPGDPTHVFENLGGGTFLDRSEELLSEEARDGYTFVAGLIDMDRDLDPDLYITMDYGPRVGPNILLRNDGGWTFTDISEQSLTNVASSIMGLGLGDLNDDAVPDLLMSQWGDGGVLLLESQEDGTWADTTVVRDIRGSGDAGQIIGWGVELADLNNDGLLDAAAAYGKSYKGESGGENPDSQPDALWIQLEDGTFKQKGRDWGVKDFGPGRGHLLVDVDDNGYLDVLKRELSSPPPFYLSLCGGLRWLRLRLHQPGANTFAVGARVEISAGGLRQTRWVMAGGQSLSVSGPPELHFGLGEAESIDTVKIFWPDGRINELEDLYPRKIYDIHRLD